MAPSRTTVQHSLQPYMRTLVPVLCGLHSGVRRLAIEMHSLVATGSPIKGPLHGTAREAAGGRTESCRGSDWEAPGCWGDLAPLRTSWHLWRSPRSSDRAASCSFLLGSSSLRAGQSPSRTQAHMANTHPLVSGWPAAKRVPYSVGVPRKPPVCPNL
jgi:hypothetical protein